MNVMLDMFTTVLDEGHMDGDQMMGGWWGGSLMWFWMLGIWLIFIVIAFLVYRDAERRGMNGLLWLILVILPWVGILFLIIYLIVRDEKTMDKSSQKSADSILDERYARGDITQREYKQMKNEINNIVN
ncbi:MAG: SHOCT domain-containing protein [Promethearchaeota archaeon]|jgi:putative membrane protein